MAQSLDRISGLADGVAYKVPARVATTANINLIGLQIIDGVQLLDGDRVLVWFQTDPTQNGIYDAHASAWSRSIDFNVTSAVTRGTQVAVTDGVISGNLVFTLQQADVTFGNTAITFASFLPLPQRNMQSYVIACTAVFSANQYELTPIIPSAQPSAYVDQQYYSFRAPATSTGPVTANVGTLPEYPVFTRPGHQATNGDISSGWIEGLVYNATINSGGPGFQIADMPVPKPIYFNVMDYGALGDGSDDFDAVQAAINDAQTVGGTVFFPAGTYNTAKGTLSITARVSLLGVGYQSDSGDGYRGHYSPPANGYVCSCIVGGITADCISIVCNEAIMIEKLQIACQLTATSAFGIAGIRCNSTSGPLDANISSVFRDLIVTSFDYGIATDNWLNFDFDNVNSIYNWRRQIQISSSHYPSYGDWTIQNALFWGGGPANDAAIAILSGGGGRIHNNKINTGGPGISSGILVEPSTNAVGANVEPLIITSNSIEGTTNGITFNKGVLNGTCTAVQITGNQIWVGNNAIIFNAYTGLSTAVSGAAAAGAGPYAGMVELTVASTAGFGTGVGVSIAGIVGTTEANGSFGVLTGGVAVIDATHFVIQGVMFANAYVSGGVVTIEQTWVNGVNITGNTLQINGGGSNLPICSLSGCANVQFVGNTFFLADVGAGLGTGVAYTIDIISASGIESKANKAGQNVTIVGVNTPAVGVSGAGIFNRNPCLVEVSVFGDGGEVTSITVNGTVVMTQSAGKLTQTFTLNPGEYIAPAYSGSSAPSWVWRAINP